jgi:RHS repeat-associated protein
MPFLRLLITRLSSIVLLALVVAAAVISIPVVAWGQDNTIATGQTVNGETYVPKPGTGQDDVHLLSESVNLATGTVSLSVDQPVRASGRRFSLPPLLTALGTGPFHVGLSQANILDLEPTFLFTSGQPYVTWSESSFTPPQQPGNPNTPVTCNIASGFTFTDRAGASHNLALGVIVKDLGYGDNGNGNCVAGQNTIPPPPSTQNGVWVGNGDGQVWATWINSTNTMNQTALWGYTPPNQIPDGPVGAFTVTDKDGYTYTFGGNCDFQVQPGQCVEYTGGVEDRNGNYPNCTNQTGCETTGIGDLSYPTTPTAPNVSVNYSLSYLQAESEYAKNSGENVIGPGPGLSVDSSPNVPEWREVVMPNLPNGEQVPPFMFYYGNYNPNDSSITNQFGLINEVVYPSGAWVKYTWSLASDCNTNSNDCQEMGLFMGQGATTHTLYQNAWAYRYALPVITERQVSFDGVHVAEVQKFAYSSTWPDWSSGNLQDWTSKQTQVTTTDNITGMSYLTVYTYSPMPVSGVLSLSVSSSVSPEVPVETQAQYYSGATSSTPLLRVVTKTWYDAFDLQEEDTTLEDGPSPQTSKVIYSYSGCTVDCTSSWSPTLPNEKDEYDFGASTPTRQTKYQYATFAANSNFGSGPSTVPVPPKPSAIQVFNSAGAEASETDYTFDVYQGGLSDPGPIYMHDDASYPASMTDRGNPTTIRRKCFVGSTACTDSVTTLTYDKAGQVTSITDPCGNATCSDVAGSNHTTTISHADSYTCLQSNGTNGTCSSLPSEITDDFVTSITNALGQTSNFTFDYYSGELTSAKDPNSKTTTYTYYDPMRRPTKTAYPDGGVTTISYTDAGPNPSATTCKELNSSQSCPTSGDISTAYTDGIGHVLETALTTDPSGTDYTFTTYDGLGQVYHSYNATRCSPSGVGQPPSSCSESTFGYKTIAYDALGRTTLVTDQDGQQVTTVYSGNQTTVTDEAGHTRSSYTDGLGRLQEVDEPVVNGDGSPGAGSLGISGSEQSTQISYPCGETTCYQTIYDGDSFSVTVNDQTVTASCGGSSATATICASNVATAINEYSSYVTATSSGGTVTLTAKTDGNSTNYTLSAYVNWDTTYFSQPSFPITVSGSTLTGGAGPQTLYTYDALNNPLTIQQTGGTTNTSNWRTRSFKYDSLGRLVSSTNPESNTAPSTGGTTATTYVYDANGNVEQKTTPAQNQQSTATVTLTYCYDSLNRLIGKAYTAQTNCPLSSPVATYGYDGTAGPENCSPTITGGNDSIGKRTSMCDAVGNESWSYSMTTGTQTTEQRTTNGILRTTTYSYDLAGDLTSLTYPSGRIVNYTVDNVARPTSAADSSTTYASAGLYAPTGGLCYLKYNGGAFIETDTYNSRLEPVEMQATTSGSSGNCTISGTGTLLDLTYGFVDPNGHNNGDVMKITNNRDATRSQAFTYDALNRLVTAGTANTSGTNCWDEAYTYDAWANLTSLAPVKNYSTGCASEPTFTYTVNAANRVTSGGFQYDTGGNLINNGYGYNAESELTTAATDAYVYDGDGNRIEKCTLVNGACGTVTKIYWYGSGSTVLEETDATGSTTNSAFSEYIFFGSSRIARRDASGDVYYYVEDHLGSSRVLVQAGQTTPCYDADFYPFGGEIIHTNNCSQNYKFEGHERDPETGLDDFGARFYNSGSQTSYAPFGRFMSADWSAIPIAVPYANLTNPQTLNLYAMVGDNPETFADLDGHGGSCKRATSATDATGVCHQNLGDSDAADPGKNQPVNASQEAAAAASQAQGAQQAQNNGWSLSWQVHASANFLVGELQGVADVTVAPIVNAVEHPVATVEGLANAVEHPVDTAKSVVNGAVDTVKAAANGDPRAFGQVVGTVAAVAYAAENVRPQSYPNAGGGGVNILNTPTTGSRIGLDVHGIPEAGGAVRPHIDITIKKPGIPSGPGSNLVNIKHWPW